MALRSFTVLMDFLSGFCLRYKKQDIAKSEGGNGPFPLLLFTIA